MRTTYNQWRGLRRAAKATVMAGGWLVAAALCWGLFATWPASAQEVEASAASGVTADDDAVEALTAGPIHEAFASPAVLDPTPNPVVPKEPPPDVPEEPPPYLPEGAVWIPGYWAWDDEREDFVWVSGVARVPPPSMRYVPGYWAKVEGGWQRVAGFWTREEEAELEYRLAPPASLESGPSSPAPGDDYFWVPGCWVYRPTGYVWQAGYWAPYQPDWIWVPARWVWTPAGCIYVPGYWDYRLAYRGQIFAPIWFRTPIYRQPGWVYRPWCVIPTNHLFVHLWVRPQYCHYYFGNYYGTRYVSLGFIPWVNITVFQQRVHIYDPFYTYCRVHYRRQGVDFVGRIQDWHRYYAQHEEARPPRTWREQQQHAPAHAPRVPEAATQLVAQRIDQVARQSDLPLKWVSLDATERRKQMEEVQQVRELNRQRRLVELGAEAQPSRPERSPGGPRTPKEGPRREPSTAAGSAPQPSGVPMPATPAPAEGGTPPPPTQPAPGDEKPSTPPAENRDAPPAVPGRPRLKLPKPPTASQTPAAATPQEQPPSQSSSPKGKKAPPPPGARPSLASDAPHPPSRSPVADSSSPSRPDDQPGGKDRRPSNTGKAPASGKRPSLERPGRPEPTIGGTSPEVPTAPQAETGNKPSAGSGATPEAAGKAPRASLPRTPEESRTPRTNQPSRPDMRPVPLQRTQQGKKAQANRGDDATPGVVPPQEPSQPLSQLPSAGNETPARPRLGDGPRVGDGPRGDQGPRFNEGPRSNEGPRTGDSPRVGEGSRPGRPAELRPSEPSRPTERPGPAGPQLIAPRNTGGAEPGQRPTGPQRLTEPREPRRQAPPTPDAFPAPALDRPAPAAPNLRSEAPRPTPPRASEARVFDGASPALERPGRPGRSVLTAPPDSPAPRPSIAPPRSEPSPRGPPNNRGASGGRSKSREP